MTYKRQTKVTVTYSSPRELKFARNPSGMPHHFDWPEKWTDKQSYLRRGVCV
jgi:hypothetical protein